MDKQQLSLGWTIEEHREREALIASLGIPKALTVPDGAASTASVARDKVLSFLYRLNYYSWGNTECFPGQTTLANDMGVNEKTIARTIKACVHLGLVRVERKRSEASRLVCNHYAIVWAELKRRINRGHPESTPSSSPAPTRPPDRSVRKSDRSGERSDMAAGAIRHSDRSDRTQWGDQSDILTPHHGDGEKNKTPAPNPPPTPRPGGDGVLEFRWGRTVERAELRDAAAIDNLYELAIAQGAAGRTDREQRVFFALVAYVLRQGRGVGFLTGLLAGRYPNKFAGNSRDWRTRPQNVDDDQAGRWIARLEADDEPPPDSYMASLQAGNETARRVAEQRARLEGRQ